MLYKDRFYDIGFCQARAYFGEAEETPAYYIDYEDLKRNKQSEWSKCFKEKVDKISKEIIQLSQELNISLEFILGKILDTIHN